MASSLKGTGPPRKNRTDHLQMCEAESRFVSFSIAPHLAGVRPPSETEGGTVPRIPDE